MLSNSSSTSMSEKKEKHSVSMQTDSSPNNNPASPEQLSPEVRDLIVALPPGKRANATRVLLKATRVTSSHTGPIPSPESFERYGNVLSSAPDRILKMAEKQLDHRIDVEKLAVRRQLNQSGIGQILAFIIALGCIGSSVWLAMHDHDTVAGVVGGATVVGLVTVFIAGRNAQKKQVKE